MNNNIPIELDPAIKKILTNLRVASPLMKNIASIMLDDVYNNFEQEGNPMWVPLSRNTIKERERKGFWPGKILQRTGQLLKSITSRFTATSAEVGTNKVYAAIHQFGGTFNQAARSEIFIRPRNKSGKFKRTKRVKPYGQGYSFSSRTITIPARPFLRLSQQAYENITTAVLKYIDL